jgi:site-specific DNA-methyltransferase (adenine-specific)
VEAAGGYVVLMSDCPWKYNNKGRGSTDGKYEGMSTKELCALQVPRIAAKDAVLFHWVTGPFLKEGIKVMEAWDFEFLTIAFSWVKYHEGSYKRCVGGGFWTRANMELCLLGIRGKPPRRVSKKVRQLIESENRIESIDGQDVLVAPRAEHSSKPAEARQRIYELMGDHPALELFARERVENWDCFGNDPALGGSDVLL